MSAGGGEGVGLDQVLGQVAALVVSLLAHVTRVHGLIVRVNRLQMLLQRDLGSAAEVATFFRALYLDIVVVDPEVTLDVSHCLASVAAELTAEWLLCGVPEICNVNSPFVNRWPADHPSHHLYLMWLVSVEGVGQLMSQWGHL